MKYTVIRNDIIQMDVDAIVLPANPKLREGSGTSTAIFQKAGRRELENACKKIIKRKGDIHIGTAVPTLGFQLDAKYIIHAVVPAWRDGNSNEYELLSSAYYSSLKLADLMSCESLAIPLLAAGNNRFDLDLAIEIAIKSIDAYEPTNKLNEVFIVIYGMYVAQKFRSLEIPFEELIDEAYVLQNDEQFIPPKKRMKRKARKKAYLIAKQYLNGIIDYFTDPETVKEIVRAGAEVAGKVIMKQFN